MLNIIFLNVLNSVQIAYNPLLLSAHFKGFKKTASELYQTTCRNTSWPQVKI